MNIGVHVTLLVFITPNIKVHVTVCLGIRLMKMEYCRDMDALGLS